MCIRDSSGSGQERASDGTGGSRSNNENHIPHTKMGGTGRPVARDGKNERNGSKRGGWMLQSSQDGKTEILVYTVMSIYTKEEFVCVARLSSRSQQRPSYCWSSPERPHRET